MLIFSAIKLFFDKKQANSKVAVVTGGATGIGLHVCKGLCMFGVRVIIGKFTVKPTSSH